MLYPATPLLLGLTLSGQHLPLAAIGEDGANLSMIFQPNLLVFCLTTFALLIQTDSGSFITILLALPDCYVTQRDVASHWAFWRIPPFTDYTILSSLLIASLVTTLKGTFIV